MKKLTKSTKFVEMCVSKDPFQHSDALKRGCEPS